MLLRKTFLSITLLSIVMTGFMPQKLYAQEAACKSLGGSVIFRDMLYGLGIGGIIGGLVVAASDSNKNSGRTVAIGALAGSGLGLGFGVYEFASRDCADVGTQKSRHEYHHHRHQHGAYLRRPGLELPQLSYVPNETKASGGWALRLAYNF